MKLIHLAGFTFTALTTLNASAAFTTDTWLGGSDFNTPTNWSSGVPTISNVAHYTGSPATAQTVNISANATVGQMTFSGSPNYTFGSTNGSVLTIDGGANGAGTLGTSSAVTFNNAVVLQTLNAGTYGAVTVNLGGALTFNNSLTINGTVSENSASAGSSLAIEGAFAFGNSGTSTFNLNKGGTSAANAVSLIYNPTSATFTGTTALTDNAAFSKIEIQTSIASGGLSSLNVGSGGGTAGAIYINKSGVSVGAPLFIGPTSGGVTGTAYTFGMDVAATASNPATGTVTSKVTLNNPTTGTGTDNFDVAANNTLTISGQVVNSAATTTVGFGVTKTGAGALILSNAAGNTFTNTTTISAGTVYANNSTSGSATGTGAVIVNGGALAGNGNITGAGITINGGGTLASGALQTGATIVKTGGYNTATGGLTVTNSSIAVTGSTSGTRTTANTANLTFDLGAGKTAGAGPLSFATPNTNTTVLTLSGSTSINFTGYTSISLVDLTAGNLDLTLSTPYLLMHSDTNSDAAFHNLVILTGTDASGHNLYALSGAGVSGVVVGVNISGSGATLGSSGTYAPIAIEEFGPDGVTPLVAPGTSTPGYLNPELYLTNGNLEVVPEPSTWAELVSGFFVLVVVLRRRSRAIGAK